MTERTSTIIALIIGAILGLIMGAGISGHIAIDRPVSEATR